MCGMVYVHTTENNDGSVEAECPNDLAKVGLTLIGIDDRDLDACWCCSHPDETLDAAGYLTAYDPVWSDYYQLAFDKRPRVELYDLKNDPNQVKNVAGQAEYKIIQAELNSKLIKVLTDTEDPRVMGDGSHFDKMPDIFKEWSYTD